MGFVPIKKICWAYDMEAPMLHLGLGFAYIQRSRTLLRCCAGLNFYPARANTFLHDAKHTELFVTRFVLVCRDIATLLKKHP